MKTYTVTMPITGKAIVEIEADSEEDAIRMALETVELQHIEEWEALETISEGNVLYAMRPWEAEAVEWDEA